MLGWSDALITKVNEVMKSAQTDGESRIAIVARCS